MRAKKPDYTFDASSIQVGILRTIQVLSDKAVHEKFYI
jgi:hypothetical protein